MTEILHDWHDFYVLMGTMAATLIGLMFVAASIGAGLFTDEHKDMMKTFLTPTIVHFCTIVFVCLSVTVPSLTLAKLGGLWALASLIGVAYSCGVWVRIRGRYRSVTSFVDQLWYAPIPIAAYLVLAAAAFVSLTRASILADWLATAVSVLLLAGIRNAWAITLWIAVQPKRD
jgi:hypothetical protein